ncbi:FtsX-like permease family protein [Buchananella hordeovulneris]|uniref:ABC3 transporter permease C-terminal domain-containing protein n=1 Tax=Buchananella hordeovulneris TaxID=52770 RepID=A0A1Q5PV21_9ACTO|nr:FtsX-like permease family protein [Buchananella hordeovulneris]OKL51431.1 hypothetical protein BSZ40_07645 [Buchananella hordeovulneris]
MSATVTAASPTGGATGLFGLTLHLTRARFRARQGETLLYLASTLAFAVCGLASLTVAAGAWMFRQRSQHPTGLLAQAVAEEPTMQTVLDFYFVLALVACALLIPTTIALAKAAAVLGARGREQRLAVLRLVGLSAREVTRMSLVDTLIQVTAGLALGVLGYLLTFSLWSNLSMQGMPIAPREMLLPWWLAAAVWLTVTAVGLAASWWGLRQVRISPLGVSRLASNPLLAWWRLGVLVAVIFVALVAPSLMQLDDQIAGVVIFGAIVLAVVIGVNIAAPFVLQQVARAVVRFLPPAGMWAARRVVANPRETWGRVSTVGLLALIAAFMARMPLTFNQNMQGAARTFAEQSQNDMTTGAMITLGVGLVVAAISILISQASAIFERANQSYALTNMGASPGYLTRVRWLEVMAPLALALLAGYGLGYLLAAPLVRSAIEFGYYAGAHAAGAVVATLVFGWLLGAVALVACQPLQRRVLAERRRGND